MPWTACTVRPYRKLAVYRLLARCIKGHTRTGASGLNIPCSQIHKNKNESLQAAQNRVTDTRVFLDTATKTRKRGKKPGVIILR